MSEMAVQDAEEREVLTKLVHAFESAEQSTADSRTERETERDYVNGYQWTADEVATLKKRKQPVVTNNRIGPKIRTLRGLETQHRAQPRAYPRTPAEEDGAQAATDALRYVMDAERWDRTRSECFDNYVVEGICGVDIKVDKRKDDWCIEITPIKWDRLWGDTHSRSPNFEDGKIKGSVAWLDLEEAEEKYPGKEDILSLTMAQAPAADTYGDVPRTRWTDPKRKRVLIVDCWTKEGGKVFYTAFTKGGILHREESPYVNDDGEHEDGFVFGSCFVDRDGNRFGMVKDWISVQDEVNKRRSKALHLMSVRQTFGNQSVGDPNELRKQLARPDGHVELQGGAKMGDDFGVLPTADMAQAQFELLQEAKNEIDAVGVNAALSGTEKRMQSGRALIQRSEQGLAELAPVFDGFKQFQLDVYRKVWNRVRQYWTAEKWIRVTDDEKNVKFVGLNQPMTLGEQLLEEFKKQGRSPQEVAQAEQQAKMDPAMQAIVGVKNNVAKMDVDIIIDDAPAAANIQAEQFEALTNIGPALAQMPPPLVEMLIEASNLRNKDKLLKKLRGDDEQSPQIMQMQQQMQEMQKALQEAQAAAQEKQGDLQIKHAELSIKEREVAIKEMEAQVKLMEMQQSAQVPPPEFQQAQEALNSKAIEIEREIERLDYERKLFDAQKQIAILKVQAAETDMVTAANNINQAEADLSRAAQEAQQATDVDVIELGS